MHVFELFLRKMNFYSGKFQERFLLTDIYRSFTQIPYENATKIINKNSSCERLRLPEKLFSDYFEFGTGGTCFSLVYSLYKILLYFNFKVYMVLADRQYGADTHAAVICEEDSKLYLLDPGFLVPEPLVLPNEGGGRLYGLATNDMFLERENNNIHVFTVRNKNKTFRYTIKNNEVGESSFFQAWKNSFEFKMMDELFITRISANSQIYLRERRVEIITREARHKYFMNDNFSFNVKKLFGISQKVVEDLLLCHQLKK